MTKYIANMDCGSGHTCYETPLTDTNKKRIMRRIRKCAEAETPAGDSALARVAVVDENGRLTERGFWESYWNGKTWTGWVYTD